MTEACEAPVMRLLARVLEYPDGDVVSACGELAERTRCRTPEAAEEFEAFAAETGSLPHTRLQEIYASTFDVNPACCLYVGYQLFGDSYKRGAFMARLSGEYRARGFDTGRELPDHLSVMLRFIADELECGPSGLQHGADPAERAAATLERGADEPEHGSDDELLELIDEAIAPGLHKIVRAFLGTSNVYGRLVQAALITLTGSGSPRDDRFARSLPVLQAERSLSMR
jgi:nitrate reductase molybdenum cofactor assembly chaperone